MVCSHGKKVPHAMPLYATTKTESHRKTKRVAYPSSKNDGVCSLQSYKVVHIKL